MKKIELEDVNKLNHKQQVMFALFCAQQVTHLVHTKHKDIALKVINLTKLWLENNPSYEHFEFVKDPSFKDTAYRAVYSAYMTTYKSSSTAYITAVLSKSAAMEDIGTDETFIIKEQYDYLHSLLK